MYLLDVLRPESLPTGITIFGIEIRFYAIIILCGAIGMACLGYFRYAKKLGMNADIVTTGLALGLLCGILGARIWYVIFNHENITSFWDAINPRSGGLAIHGGFFGAFIFVLIYCKVKHMDFLMLLEIVVPIFIACQIIGRWGNFFNQEAYGPLIRTFGELTEENIQAHSIGGIGTYSSPYMLSDEVLASQREALSGWLIPKFIINNMYIVKGELLVDASTSSYIYVSGYYHPTFLYESLMNLPIVLFMFFGRKYIKKYYVADSLPIYLMGYGVVRFIIEILRQDPLTIGNTGIKIAQVISILFFALGLGLLILRRVFKFRLEPCPEVYFKPGHSLFENGYDPRDKQEEKEELIEDKNDEI